MTLGRILSGEREFGQVKCTTRFKVYFLPLEINWVLPLSLALNPPHLGVAKVAKAFEERILPEASRKIRLEGPLSQLVPRNWI